MSSKELKEIREEKRRLLERQRELQAKSDEKKDERKTLRSQIAEARKDARAFKSELRELSAKIQDTFKSEAADDILELSYQLQTTGDNLAAAVRVFGEASQELANL